MFAPVISVADPNRTNRLMVVKNGIVFTNIISIPMTISEWLLIIWGGRGVMISVLSFIASLPRRVDFLCKYGLLIPHTSCAILIDSRVIGEFLITPESTDLIKALELKPAVF